MMITKAAMDEWEENVSRLTKHVNEAVAERDAALAELARVKAESEGRLKILNEKVEELRREWIRAENAEGKVVEFQQAYSKILHAASKIVEITQTAPGV